MCLGLPMQVESLGEGWAQVSGRGESRRVRTALVDALSPGDWVLVFLDSAVERIDEQRAKEVDEALDLLQSAMDGSQSPESDPSFFLPSQLDATELAKLTGGQPVSKEFPQGVEK